MEKMNVVEDKANSSKIRCVTEENTILDQENTNKLPVELKLHIVEFLGCDTYAAVTGDHDRADTLLLQERNYKKYFDSRSFDYCILEDAKLARCVKNCTDAQLTRLPMLAERQFLTYFECQLLNYNATEDPLLNVYFGDINKSRLPMLVYGNFEDYKKSMTDDYEPTKDRLLMTFLGTSAENVVQCLNVLIKFDKIIKCVRDASLSDGKLYFLRAINAHALCNYLNSMNVTVPECFHPLYLCKTLSNYTEDLEAEYLEYLELQNVCRQCGERSISEETGSILLETDSWFNARVIIFCSKCAALLLCLSSCF